MLTPTWDTLLAFALFSFVVLGLVIRKYKTGVLIIAQLVGLTVANEIGLELFRFIRRLNFEGGTSLFMVKVIVFAFIAFLLFIEGEYLTGSEDGGGVAQSIGGAVFGMLAGGIFIASVVTFMSAADQGTILAKSSIARSIYSWKLFFIVPFPLYLAISSLIKRFR